MNDVTYVAGNWRAGLDWRTLIQVDVERYDAVGKLVALLDAADEVTAIYLEPEPERKRARRTDEV